MINSKTRPAEDRELSSCSFLQTEYTTVCMLAKQPTLKLDLKPSTTITANTTT